jgi:hypothetical protein
MSNPFRKRSDSDKINTEIFVGPNQNVKQGTEGSSTGHISRPVSKETGTRRTNSLADLFMPKRTTPTPQSIPSSKESEPKRGFSEKKSEFQRLCCSFRRTRRAKTALELGVKSQELPIPSYGTINSSAMSVVNDPNIARQAILALEKNMTKKLFNQMSSIMSVDESDDSQKNPRPNGFASELNSKPGDGR